MRAATPVLASLAMALHTAAMAQVPGQQQAAPDIVEYKGIVAPAREVEMAPRLDGLLSKINFTAGQLVKKGDLLFEFASKSNELARALAQANLKQAEAQLGLAEVNLKNKQALRARNVGSEMDLLETQAQREMGSAKVEQARANAGGAEIALQQMKLYAPISGIVSRPFIKEGAYITKEARDQSRLATVVQLDPICVIGQAPAAIYFQRGGGVLKTLEQTSEQREFALVLSTGDKYPHKDRLVAGPYDFNPATQTTEVTVEFPNPDHLLRPGLNVTLQSMIRTQ